MVFVAPVGRLRPLLGHVIHQSLLDPRAHRHLTLLAALAYGKIDTRLRQLEQLIQAQPGVKEQHQRGKIAQALKDVI